MLYQPLLNNLKPDDRNQLGLQVYQNPVLITLCDEHIKLFDRQLGNMNPRKPKFVENYEEKRQFRDAWMTLKTFLLECRDAVVPALAVDEDSLKQQTDDFELKLSDPFFTS